MRSKNLMLIFAALATAFFVAACGQSAGDQQSRQGNQEGQKQAREEAAQNNPPDKQVAPQKGPEESGGGVAAVEPPSDNMMKLTIPKMERIKDDEIPTGLGTDEVLFHDYAGVHLKNTGFPWEKEANVYIAGHRLGFENTDSWLAFDDLNKLEKGDEVYITDSEGRKYTYEVFRKFVTTPENLAVLAPVDGKNIVTLQTCTKPDYVNRFLVRGELKSIEGA
jgi:sortase A